MSSQLPGFEAGFNASPRDVLYSSDGTITVGIVIDGDKSIDGTSPTQTYDLRAGWLMGRITATGRWTPCKRSRTKSAASGGESSHAGDYTIVPVDDASPFRVGDVVSIGNDVNLTITNLNYVTNTITVNDPIAFGADETVAASDGSATCRGVLLDFVRLRNDDNSAARHRSGTLLVQGMVNTSLVLGDLATIRLDTSAKLAGIRFTDEYGIS